jgi:CDGSH-type Zn-finger protein
MRRHQPALRQIEHPDQMALRRCGHPGNEPFCDGTDLITGFDGTLAS